MPEISVSRGRVVALVALALVLLYAGGKLLSGGPSADPVPLAPVRASAPVGVVVHVVGAVRRPGLYSLKHGTRIADALARAGGATPKADLSLVNLASPLADGQQIVVPARAPPVQAAGSSSGVGGTAAPSGPVHLNTATIDELDALPGVGPVTAQKILDYREKHGAFSSVDDLDAIPGIGPARLEQLRDLVAP